MTSKPLNAKLCYLFSSIFVLFIGILMVMSMFMHCETYIFDYDQTKSVTQHTFYIYLGLALFGIVIAGLFCFFLEYIFSVTGESEKICNAISVLCGLVMLVAGVFWIFFNDSLPAYDQKTVYEEAQRIAGFREEPFNIEYFSYFSRNRGITLLVAGAMKIFGNHLYSFRIFNVLAALVIYYSIYRAVKMIYHNFLITSMTSLLLMMFYPLVIYTSYYYGTLLSIAFTSLGLYATVALCETGKRWYAVVFIIAFPLGILMHQSAAIGLIASVIYLLIGSQGKNFLRNIFIFALTVALVFLFMKLVDMAYEHITGAEADASSVPASCTVYMGLTSATGASGPGSQDGMDARIFNEGNRDGKVANEIALDGIFTVIREYCTGKRSLKFFVEKTEYQWLDPTFGARKTIRMNDSNIGEPLNSDTFIAFYKSSLRTIVFKLSVGMMLLSYMGALIAGIKSIHKVWEYPAVILVQLYVIGGGAFQMIWESLSRYCLGYFIWLLPLEAFGICSLYSFFKNRNI